MKKVVIFTIISIILLAVFITYNKPDSLSFSSTKEKNKSLLSSKDPLVVDDFKIANIMLGEPISKVFSLLGKPNKVESGSRDDSLAEYYYYPGIMVASSKFYTKKVGYILIKKSGIETFRGIEVGDSETAVFERYGEVKKVQDGLFYEKVFDDFHNYGIEFLIERGKVKEIMIFYVMIND